MGGIEGGMAIIKNIFDWKFGPFRFMRVGANWSIGIGGFGVSGIGWIVRANPLWKRFGD